MSSSSLATIGSPQSFDSGINMRSDVLEAAGLSQEQMKAIDREQQMFRDAVRPLLPRAEDSKRIQYVYTVPVAINPFMQILAKELAGTDTCSNIPKQFEKDHINPMRAQFIEVRFPGREGISVTDEGKQQELIKASEAFAKSIAGDVSQEEYDILRRTVLLSTTQILPNYICGQAVMDQQMKRAEAGSVGSKFNTTIRKAILLFSKVPGIFYGSKSRTFTVEILATISTGHNALTDETLSDSQVIARRSLGMEPILTGRVRALMTCEQNASGGYSYKDIRGDSSTKMHDQQII